MRLQESTWSKGTRYAFWSKCMVVFFHAVHKPLLWQEHLGREEGGSKRQGWTKVVQRQRWIMLDLDQAAGRAPRVLRLQNRRAEWRRARLALEWFLDLHARCSMVFEAGQELEDFGNLFDFAMANALALAIYHRRHAMPCAKGIQHWYRKHATSQSFCCYVLLLGRLPYLQTQSILGEQQVAGSFCNRHLGLQEVNQNNAGRNEKIPETMYAVVQSIAGPVASRGTPIFASGWLVGWQPIKTTK